MYVLKKILLTVLVLVGAATCSFGMLRLIPGDPAEALAGPQATLEDVALVRQSMNLDRPLARQYLTYMGNLAKGDLGYSYRTHRTVVAEILARWPATLRLSLTSMLVAILVGVPLGVHAARKRGKFADSASMVASFVGVSMPSFWLGMILIVWFSVQLHLFPFSGDKGPLNYVLPSLTLGLGVAANIARMTRASMLDTLGQDYVRTARGKGLSEFRVVNVHALRNAAAPIVTIIGLQLGTLLGGQVVTEMLFVWPGLGRMIVDSLNARDYMVVQGGILVLAATFALLNLLTDLACKALDPRIRL
ncbi:MAG: ABC transporter permease [Holophaga sp.]|jgi:ABC-type dipeptide/oligopeptide/nickel transport system permease component